MEKPNAQLRVVLPIKWSQLMDGRKLIALECGTQFLLKARQLSKGTTSRIRPIRISGRERLVNWVTELCEPVFHTSMPLGISGWLAGLPSNPRNLDC